MPPIFPVEVCHNIIECGGDDNSVVNITTLLSKTWFDLTVAKRWRQLTSHGFPKTGDYERTLQKLQAHPARCDRVKRWVIAGSHHNLLDRFCGIDCEMLLRIMCLLPKCVELTVSHCLWSQSSITRPRGILYDPKPWSRITLDSLICMDKSLLSDIPLFATTVDELTCTRIDVLGDSPFTGIGKDYTLDDILQQRPFRAIEFHTDLAIDVWDTHHLPPNLPLPVPFAVTSLYLDALTPEALVLASHHIRFWRFTLRDLRITCTKGVTNTDASTSVLEFPLYLCLNLRRIEIALPDEPLVGINRRLKALWDELPLSIQYVSFVFPPLVARAFAESIENTTPFLGAHLPELVTVQLGVYHEIHTFALMQTLFSKDGVNDKLRIVALPHEFDEQWVLDGRVWHADY
ncbi:hypothetical protein BC629DRAFT_399610 [Irpex lacteus]|nr:hypothetical protein BC629DRAFT_399610 [Irpex lacteus]